MTDLVSPDGPRLAFGTWRFSSKTYEEFGECLSICREFGLTHIDTADVYGVDEAFGAVETLLGRLREEKPALFDGTTLATKIGIRPGCPYNSSPDYLEQALSESLARLNTQSVDLLYIHRPDNLAHPAEVGRTLDGFVAAGRAKAIAVSNHTPAQVAALQIHMEEPIVAHQTEISPLYVERIFDGTLDEAMAFERAVFAWSPLGGGRLFADRARMDDRTSGLRDIMDELAEKYGVSLTGIAYAFVHTLPAKVVSIIGTTRPERLRETLEEAHVTLERADWYRLLEASLGHKMP